MMPLSAFYPEDKKTWNCKDEYMFGENILVAPIMKANYTPELIAKTDENTGWDRKESFNVSASSDPDFMAPYTTSVYLPKGKWWDFETNRLYKGGMNIEKEATIKTLPVFIKAGAILPIDRTCNTLQKSRGTT